MKYQKIYQVLEKHSVHIRHDASGWCYGKAKSYVQLIRPLWIVAETDGLRLWISHDAGRLSVTTADRRLHCDSRQYHESHKCRSFRTQAEMAAYLDQLFQDEDAKRIA